MPSGSRVYRFGPFELDAPRGRLFRGATRVPLSDSQFAILMQLISHVGEVVSKDTLANAAWRKTAFTDNRSTRPTPGSARRSAAAKTASDIAWFVPGRCVSFTVAV
jgi:DNA-binding response OmpR family regulator